MKCVRDWIIIFVGGLLAAVGPGPGCGNERFELESLRALEVDPPSLAFLIDSVAPQATSQASLNAKNTGDGPIVIDGLTIEGGDGVLTLGTGLPLPPIEPGGALPITIRYSRSDDELHLATLVIRSNDHLRPLLRVPLAVQRGKAWLVPAPGRVSFASGETAKTLDLLNTGNAPATLYSVRFTGALGFAADFGTTTVDSAGPELTFEAPIVIAAGARYRVPVRTSAPEVTEATLVVFGDADNTSDGLQIPFTTAAPGPCVLVRPASVDFGAKNVGDVSHYPVTIESCGDDTLVISSLAFATLADVSDPMLASLGVDAPTSHRFALATAPPTRLEAGQVTDLDLVYSGGAEPSVDRGYLVIRSNARLPVVIVPLRAETSALPPPPPPPPPPVIEGCTWTGGTSLQHTVEIGVAGDDAWEGWVDGQAIPRVPGAQPWNVPTWHTLELPSGCHTMTLHAWDLYAVTSGVIVVVKVDGTVRWVSGDARPEWHVSGPDAPVGDWHALAYDDSAWPSPSACENTQPWAGMPYDLYGLGARWAWWNASCRDLSNAYFRLVFTVD